MEVLPDFDLHRPTTIEALLSARAENPGSRLVGGGTDLIVNVRRGIGDPPPALIDVNGVEAMKTIELDGPSIRIGASVNIATLAGHPGVREQYPGLREAAHSIAGPTHRVMGTVGGNVCLDTRCIFYNQSEWWRAANDYCLKYRGSKCHVAVKSQICFATFSGDLAPALLVLDAEVEVVGPDGGRTLPLADLYTGDGEKYLSLGADELVVAVRATMPGGLRTGYDKMRVRRSIEYPLAGVAVGLRRDGDAVAELRVAVTGTNPRPVRLEGLDALEGRPLDDAALEELEAVMRPQIMSMNTTFTPGYYRRRVACVLARRVASRLYDQ